MTNKKYTPRNSKGNKNLLTPKFSKKYRNTSNELQQLLHIFERNHTPLIPHYEQWVQEGHAETCVLYAILHVNHEEYMIYCDTSNATTYEKQTAKEMLALLAGTIAQGGDVR